MDQIKRKPKVFILGISGFVGYNLALRLHKNFLLSGAYCVNRVFLPDMQIFPVNPNRPELLDSFLRVQDPDIMINAIGVSDRKVIEQNPKKAEVLNVEMAVSMAGLAAKMRAKFIQISSSEIYDGNKGDYREDEADYTMQVELGKQKVAAESYIRSQTLESTILRVGKLVGLGHPYRPSEFDQFRQALGDKKKTEASKKRTYNYLSHASLAQAVNLILEGEFPGRHRIFNLGGPKLSKFDLYEGWARLVEGNSSLVIPETADRKRDISMQINSFKAAFPQWKQETQEQLYLNLLTELAPGVGVKKWQKTLQIP
jgi:dTDP-4-dehydrorhamnose reductase